MFNTPILYIIFNRLDTVKQTFPKIKEQQPKQLFIAADGPRKNCFGEKEKCLEVRNWVLSQIDWDCKVETLFREENLGCGKAVSGAITWFFDNVEKGIILEDDCLPNKSFFPYCEELLNYYNNDPEVMHITGDNPLLICKTPHNESYYFAKIQHCWGWASWSRAWEKYNFDVGNFDTILNSNPYFKDKRVRTCWKQILTNVQNGNINTWDYQWSFTIIKNNGYCINPSKNLITNIGFSPDSTHFQGSSYDNPLSRKSFEIKTIIHPEKKKFNYKFIKKINYSYGLQKPSIIFSKCFIKFPISLIKLILRKMHLFNLLKRCIKQN